MPGDTVFVKAGIYRERVAPPRSGEAGKPIVFMGEPGQHVFIRGSEIWTPDWQHLRAGIYYAVPADSLFDDRSPEYVDNHNPFKVFLSSTPHQRQGKQELDSGYGGDPNLLYTCGQAFVNGKVYMEVPFTEELEAGTWYYEAATGRIYIDFGKLEPSEQLVEITTRRRIFAPLTRGLGHIIVQGFIMEHCGNQYPTNFWKTDANAQKGAMGIEAGHHWIIRRNVIRFAKTFALDAGRVDRHSERYAAHDNLIEENYVVENGSAGIMACGSENLVIRNNVIQYNNTLGFLGKNRWEQAGIKCHYFKDGCIHENYIAGNQLIYGIWLDNQFPDSRVSRNVIINNGRAGISLEMSDYQYDRLFVDNNIVIGNSENSVYIHDASGATFAHNLFANTLRSDEEGGVVCIRQMTTRTKSRCHSFYNNLFIDDDIMLDISYPSHRSGPQRIDYNVYDALATDRKFSINKACDVPSPWDDSKFIAMIRSELGEVSLGKDIMDGHGTAMLTFEEWQAFWDYHELHNDVHSQLNHDSSVNYDPVTHNLTIKVTFDPNAIGTMNHKFADNDFFGEAILQDDSAVPGPFQNIKKGVNIFKVWHGLPILRRGELPIAGE